MVCLRCDCRSCHGDGALFRTESDYVVIAAPYIPETEKLFRLEQFQQMKPNAILVNTSRGAIVDLTNLAVALDNKLIAGAALDVFEEELLPAAHPLWQMENVRRFASGEELLNIVNKEMWC